MMEKDYLKKGMKLLVGVDEAGRGPLAGPVVAAAVLYDEKLFLDKFLGARDSKKLSLKQRISIHEEIMLSGLVYGVGIVDNFRIDEINILNATFEAMRIAINELEKKLDAKVDVVLVDGSHKIRGLKQMQFPIVNGDALIKTISLASIVAKVTRDDIMLGYHSIWPEYGFDRHKGYGTQLHLEKIRELGHERIHRKSFKPKALSQKSKI